MVHDIRVREGELVMRTPTNDDMDESGDICDGSDAPNDYDQIDDDDSSPERGHGDEFAHEPVCSQQSTVTDCQMTASTINTVEHEESQPVNPINPDGIRVVQIDDVGLGSSEWYRDFERAIAEITMEEQELEENVARYESDSTHAHTMPRVPQCSPASDSPGRMSSSSPPQDIHHDVIEMEEPEEPQDDVDETNYNANAVIDCLVNLVSHNTSLISRVPSPTSRTTTWRNNKDQTRIHISALKAWMDADGDDPDGVRRIYNSITSLARGGLEAMHRARDSVPADGKASKNSIIAANNAVRQGWAVVECARELANCASRQFGKIANKERQRTLRALKAMDEGNLRSCLRNTGS